MNNHFPYHRGFVREDQLRSVNGKNALPAISFGYFTDSQNCLGKITVRWRMINGVLSPTLSVDEESWNILPLQRSIYQRMQAVAGLHVDPARFIGLLEESGFVDLTVYETQLGVQATLEEQIALLQAEIEEIKRSS